MTIRTRFNESRREQLIRSAERLKKKMWELQITPSELAQAIRFGELVLIDTHGFLVVKHYGLLIYINQPRLTVVDVNWEKRGLCTR
jgi:hypothetical protein